MSSKKPSIFDHLPSGEAESTSAAAAADDPIKPPPDKAEAASSPSKHPLQAGAKGLQNNKPDPEDPYQGPATPLEPKVGRLSSRKPNVSGENVMFAASLAATTTTMLETVNHLSTQLTRLVALLQGDATAMSTSHVIVILDSMERALWSHSSCQGLLNNVQRLKEECYAEVRRAAEEASEDGGQVIIGSGGDF